MTLIGFTSRGSLMVRELLLFTPKSMLCHFPTRINDRLKEQENYGAALLLIKTNCPIKGFGDGQYTVLTLESS